MESRTRLPRCCPAPFTLLLFLLIVPSPAFLWADDEGSFPPEQLEYFETRVRPLLAERCFECHSGKSEKLMAGLRLDGRPLALEGGDSGAAVVPGKPDESLLIDAVRWESFEMPPDGKLKEEEVEVLVKWVEMGAPWPVEGQQPLAAKSPAGEYDWDRWRSEHWSFRPVQKPAPPVVRDATWAKGDLDRFVLAQLEARNLQPAVRAEPRILVRRIYLDLLGLLPAPNETEAFVQAAETDYDKAVQELVDRLLASPHYGERWGRHWLDVARYSDGHGGFLDNNVYSEAWRYRDWVVQAFNEDVPINQFLRLQIAGDLDGAPRDGVATGFFALGPTYRSDGGDPESVAQAKAETLSDRIDTLARGMLGLTVACARCHDHKFDPIPQQDYYSLAAVFNNSGLRELPLVEPQVVESYDQHHAAIRDFDNKLKQLNNRLKQEKREATEEEQRQRDEWTRKLDELRKTAPAKYDFAHALQDTGSAEMHVAIRGDLRKQGELAPRRFLRILAEEAPPLFAEGSGRRGLAEAVADPRNPLTMRVFVNRVWLHHFGKALVRTPSNFGVLGETPTHPELLDWLTASFLENGCSLKWLHREILLSATYQMSSDYREEAYRIDGDNRWLWRMNARRLDVEAWRDAVLSVTGELDLTLGGRPLDRVDSNRRTLYFKVSRNGDVFATDEFLRLFDFPLMRATIDQRPVSIVPQQFLFLMNSPFMVERSRKLASRLAQEADSDQDRITLAYQLLFQRAPREEELAIGLAFLRETPGDASLSAWDQYAQVLLGSNEFMFMR